MRTPVASINRTSAAIAREPPYPTRRSEGTVALADFSSETNFERSVGTRHVVATAFVVRISSNDVVFSPPVTHNPPCIRQVSIHHSPPMCVAGSGE
ncbi:Uncharacterised protein [Mycobacterium tuberculosis]|uniref:Uncharacterized protein n=1 Tax=Mycobacterium tuberculosis TaxID=1773 RepID=A0A0T7LV70_MYCTX|nr:Uncharacterised protein [Mycobacterium tuberculosis]CFE53654.1 Uncharacterised protein [Mycobacterium tuberculosis]CFS15441.1 Uncharacterised protein [Mycobacterium tuberculosis]CFS34646.1 Uncharacterised protein [Mycobacterium tuberculosis]CKR50967.1 Uncharacterised protein [Mycobacterium tuberculosis]